jgi:hypothetical protein
VAPLGAGDLILAAFACLLAILCLAAALWSIRADPLLLVGAVGAAAAIVVVYVAGIAWKGIKSP